MHPIDTHSISISIYADYLEDNNVDTTELRNEDSKIHYYCLYIYDSELVGTTCALSFVANGFVTPDVGTHQIAYDNVGFGCFYSSVAAAHHDNVGII